VLHDGLEVMADGGELVLHGDRRLQDGTVDRGHRDRGPRVDQALER
jgi:hypothetical protein